MKNFSHLIEKIESTGEEIYWQGKTDNKQIELLEKELGVNFPNSFKEFLNLYGGGGVIDDEISGIENNDFSLKNGGTVLYDTLDCRESFSLPEHLVTIFYKYEEIAWCLDTSQMNSLNECPVVSYDLFSKKVTNKIADNFESFFENYLELRAEIS